MENNFSRFIGILKKSNSKIKTVKELDKFYYIGVMK